MHDFISPITSEAAASCPTPLEWSGRAGRRTESSYPRSVVETLYQRHSAGKHGSSGQSPDTTLQNREHVCKTHRGYFVKT